MHMAAIVGQAETVVYAKTCSVNLQNQFYVLCMLPILRIMLKATNYADIMYTSSIQ